MWGWLEGSVEESELKVMHNMLAGNTLRACGPLFLITIKSDTRVIWHSQYKSNNLDNTCSYIHSFICFCPLWNHHITYSSSFFWTLLCSIVFTRSLTHLIGPPPIYTCTIHYICMCMCVYMCIYIWPLTFPTLTCLNSTVSAITFSCYTLLLFIYYSCWYNNNKQVWTGNC